MRDEEVTAPTGSGPTPAAGPTAGLAMDPRKLLYLATIIEQGSLAKAARALSISQPALSKSMDRLEAELGLRLLERGPAGIKPTGVGELIYAHARLIKDEMSLAEARVQSEMGGAQVVTLGTLPSLASNVIPQAVGLWKKKHPNVLLRVVEKVQVELLLGLLRGDFSFIVGQTEFYDIFLDGLKQRVLFRDRLRVFARAGHPLLKAAELSWADLVIYPWVCPMVGWPQRTILEKVVASAGQPAPEQLVECGSVDFTRSLISATDHLALLPSHSVSSDVSSGAIKPLDITVPAMRRDIAVIFREASPPDEFSRDLIADIEAVGHEIARSHS